MRNKIPNIVDEVIINDFYRGCCDEDLIRELLKKPPISAEQLFRDADRYILAFEHARDFTDKRPSKEKQDKPADAPRQDRRWDKRP